MLIHLLLVLAATVHSSFDFDISSPLPGQAGMVCDFEEIDEQSFIACGMFMDNFYPQFTIFDLKTDANPPTPGWGITSDWQYLKTDNCFISQGAMALDFCENGIPSIISCGQIQDNSVHTSGIHVTQSGVYEDFSEDYYHETWEHSLLYDIEYLEQDGLWVSCGEIVIESSSPIEEPADGYILVGNTDGTVLHEILEESTSGSTWQSIEYDTEEDIVLLGGHTPSYNNESKIRVGILNHLTGELQETNSVLPGYIAIDRSFLVRPVDNDGDRNIFCQISSVSDDSGYPNALLISIWSYDGPSLRPEHEQHLITPSRTFGGKNIGQFSFVEIEEVPNAVDNIIEFKVLVAGAECTNVGIPIGWYLFPCELTIDVQKMSIEFKLIDENEPYSLYTDDFIPSDFIFDSVDPIEGTGCGDTGLFSLGEISLFTLSESPEVPSISRVSNTSSYPLEITVINHSSDGFPSIRISSGNNSWVNLNVFDITGRTVISRTVDVPYYAELGWAELVGEQSGLASGIYLISADDNDSESMATAKILLY